jgi:hypothetical protein
MDEINEKQRRELMATKGKTLDKLRHLEDLYVGGTRVML